MFAGLQSKYVIVNYLALSLNLRTKYTNKMFNITKLIGVEGIVRFAIGW